MMETICSQADQGVLVCAACLLYDFQTLITGGFAIVLAAIGTRSVWRQLKDSNLQARILHRETLAELLRQALRRAEEVKDQMREPMDAAQRATLTPFDEPISVRPHQAHSLESMFHGLLNWYLVDLANTEHSEIEAQKYVLKVELESLCSTFHDAHWVAHNDQQGDGYSFSDEEWADIENRHEEAKSNAFQSVRNVSAAYRELKESQEAWARTLRDKIAKLDALISGES